MALHVSILNTSFGIWGHYTVVPCFTYLILFIKCIYLLTTAYFLSFANKNLWFSSQRRREGVVRDANGSISKHWVLCIVVCPLSNTGRFVCKIH